MSKFSLSLTLLLLFAGRPILFGQGGQKLVFFPASSFAQKSGMSGPSEITILGDVKTPLTLTAADLKKMDRVTLPVNNPHTHKEEVYEGVPLSALLEKAGVPHGDEMRGPWMASYLRVDAADGYRVVYSLAELDSAFLDSGVILADAMDSAPLGPGEGPFKIVAPHDKRPARWIRMVKSLTVVRLPN